MPEINEKVLQEKIRWSPHEKQKDVIKTFDNSREILMRAGRRFGKSQLCSYLALRELLKPNKNIWVVAPNYNLSEIIFDNIAGWVGQILTHGQSYTITKNPVPSLDVAHGSKMQIKSAENATSLLGRSTDLVILDEASRLPQYIWERYIYPTTIEREGKIMYISTPTGKNWFYDKELELGDSAFHFTTYDNPYIKKEELEKLKNNHSELTFRQEYLAEYISEANAVFPNIRDIVEDYPEKGPEPGGLYIMGVDLGRRADASAIIILSRLNHKVVYIEEIVKADYALQKEHIKALSAKYNNAKIIIESTGPGDPVYQDLLRDGANVQEFRTAGHNKAQLIEKLAIFIEQRSITIPEHKDLMREMMDYEVVMSSSGFNKYKGRGKKPDDLVIALALAVWDLPTAHRQSEDEGRDITKRRRVKMFNEYE